MTQTKTTGSPKSLAAATYDSVADGYDRLRFHRHCAERLVSYCDLRPGMTVMDAGTGTGSAAIAAAGIVGRAGSVVGIDLSRQMLTRAGRRISSAGLDNVALHQGDVSQLKFPDDHFDVVLCASTLYLLPDMLDALREWRRVTKPGGLVVFSGFGEEFRRPLVDLFEKRIRRYGVRVPPQRRSARLSDPETCRRLLEDAGLSAIEVQIERLDYWLETADAWWEEIWYSGQRHLLSRLAPGDLARFKEEHLTEVAQLATEQGIRLEAVVNLARGRKPARA